MLSIIFLHWVEEGGPLKETLLSLESVFRYTTVPYELIIVSNGSTEETNIDIRRVILENQSSDAMRKYGPPKILFNDGTKNYSEADINSPHLPTNIKYINLETNEGVSKGFNAGLKEIDKNSKYISIFSNDWFITNNTFENLIEALDADEAIGFVTACTNWGAGSMCFDRANPVAFPKPEMNIHAEGFLKLNESFGEHQDKAGKIITRNNFPAMGWTMKREVFDNVGLMDERIFCANDVAYFQRAKLFGWTSYTVWNAWIYHEWHSSFSQINDKETYSYLRPKDQADLQLIRTDEYYKDKNVQWKK